MFTLRIWVCLTAGHLALFVTSASALSSPSRTVEAPQFSSATIQKKKCSGALAGRVSFRLSSAPLCDLLFSGIVVAAAPRFVDPDDEE